jgi:uncharacterized protein
MILLKNKHNNISVLGISLGTGVAIYVTSERPVKKLGLITPFDCIVKIA